MRSVHATLLALLLSLVVLAPALAQTGGPGPGARRGPMDRAAERDATGMHEREWSNLSETARTRGLERAEQARLFARFTYANGNASGRFVTFTLDPATGALTNYAVLANNSTSAFFARVAPTGFTGNGTPKVHGATLVLDGGNQTFAAHNNPTGLFAYRGENVSVAFTLAPGANATAESGNRSAQVTVGNLHGHVILNGNGTLNVSATTITATSADPMGGVLFAAHPSGPDAGVATANLHAMRDAVAQGRLGGILSVVDADGAAVGDATYLGVAMRARNVSQGRVNVTVSSPDPAGKSVVIQLDGSIVNASQLASLAVTLDGRAIPRAANATNALLSAPGTPGAAWFVSNGTGGGVQVIVDVPGFSEHDIGISTTAATGPVATTPIASTPGGTVPATGTPAGTSPAATSPATGATPTPTGTTGNEGGEKGSPGFGLALLVAALAAVAVLARRRA